MAKVTRKKVVLFDAYALLFRAYHALPDFATSAGEPTGALYGLATMLIRVIADLKPEYMIACYDLAETTFRKQVYDGYKAHRKKTDDELVAQIENSQKIFEAFNIPIYSAPGFEADDVIGTIVEETKGRDDLQIIIASGDMDTLQLVDTDQVVVYTLKKGIQDTIFYDEKAVRERFGFDPKLLVDYKGLRGDPSDNIIGIAGIGEKTASILIQEFGSIEQIYEVLDRDEAAVVKAGIKPRIIELLKNGRDEALFSKELATIRRNAPIVFQLPDQSWRAGLDLEMIEAIFKQFEFRTLGARLQSALGQKSIESAAPLPVAPETTPEPHAVKKTAIALWLLNSDLSDPTLDDIYTFARTRDFAAASAMILGELEARGLQRVYTEIELPLMPIIDAAERQGILIDRAFLEKLSSEYHGLLSNLEQEIYTLAGKEFNINSPKQLGEILFDSLNLSVKGLKKTAGGARSTRESELEKLRDSHPIIEKILAQREVSKLLSTYIDTIPKLLDEHNRLHTTLHQTGTTTGRMSSSDPNLQNIPAKQGLGFAVRKAFIAPPGWKLVSCDYSQIEMRILAELSGDEGLIEIFREGKDVHSSVASRVFGVPESEVTKDMRRRAKVINFGIVYGMGVNALKDNLGTNRADAQAFYDNYFKTFPKIHDYFEQIKREALEKGYTETLFGRRRYFPGLTSKLPYLRAMAERMAMNAPIQGTATGDLTKLAMIRAHDALVVAKLDDRARLLLQVHDELLFEIEETVLPQALDLIREAMEHVYEGAVPLRVNCEQGPSWGELEKVS